ncbi:MAG TPA: helix-turn-helix transcriptional regulator [Chloroflexota bacterium]
MNDDGAQLGANLDGLGRFIRERWHQLGLTQAELGKRLGWSQERISILEHGKYGLPSLPLLDRLASALESSLNEILLAMGYGTRGAATAVARHAPILDMSR